MQISHSYNMDTLIIWLKTNSCVEDAFWDKCETKIQLYPGWIVIGAKFKTQNGVKEKCFHIQQGKTGSVNIFGWKPHVFKSKNALVYKKMYDCEGFIEQQRKKCTN